MKKTIITILIIVLLASMVNAAGNCELDKYYYHPGETALFSCSCTLGNEKNVLGNIVWFNQTGNTVMKNVSVNTGDCIGSFFSNSFIVNGSHYLGNATFMTDDVNWADANDIITDEFNVSTSTEFDCIITNVTSSITNLGELGSVDITVRNAGSLAPLVHANCQVSGYNIDGVPILFEPYGEGHTDRITGASGVVGFQHLMNEAVWEPNTTYLYGFTCHCINDSDESCFDEVAGNDAGFKTCTARVAFTTGLDNRKADSSETLVLVFGVGIVCFLLLYLAFKVDQTKHVFLQIFMILFVTGLLLLIGAATMNIYDNNLSTIFVGALTWFVRAFWVYVFVRFAYEALGFGRKVVPK